MLGLWVNWILTIRSVATLECPAPSEKAPKGERGHGQGTSTALHNQAGGTVPSSRRMEEVVDEEGEPNEEAPTVESPRGTPSPRPTGMEPLLPPSFHSSRITRGGIELHLPQASSFILSPRALPRVQL